MASKEAVESKLEEALSLVRRGMYIFPVKAGQKLPPLVKFKEESTRDEDQVRAWWGLPHHQPNIGIYTGRFSEGLALVVVDVDPKNGGDSSFFDLELAGNAFPPTYTQRTPSGGRHLVYAVPEAMRQGVNILGPGLDIRSRGGYILAAGSHLAAGRYDVARDMDVAPCPEWIAQALAGSKKRRKSTRHLPASVPGDAEQPAAAQKFGRAKRWLAVQPVAIQGAGGDHTTYTVACGLLDYGLTNEECFGLLFSYPDHANSWNSRCQPPWSPDELRTKIDNALQYRQDQPGSALPHFEPQPAVGGDGLLPDQSQVEDAGQNQARGATTIEGNDVPGRAIPVPAAPKANPGGGYKIQLTGAERPGDRSFASMAFKLF